MAPRPDIRSPWSRSTRGDNDVRRFLDTVVAALQRTSSEVGRDAKAVLDTANGDFVDAVLTSLVNDLDTLVGATVLVFDDYHEITAPAIHEVLVFLLAHLPSHVCIALTTRSDPPLPLARLRSNGGLVELRAADRRPGPAHPSRAGLGPRPRLHREGLRDRSSSRAPPRRFDDLGTRRVVARCFVDNEASWQLMERVGMRREALAKAESLHRAGRWLDTVAYALLAEEWREPG